MKNFVDLWSQKSIWSILDLFRENFDFRGQLEMRATRNECWVVVIVAIVVIVVVVVLVVIVVIVVKVVLSETI